MLYKLTYWLIDWLIDRSPKKQVIFFSPVPVLVTCTFIGAHQTSKAFMHKNYVVQNVAFVCRKTWILRAFTVEKLAEATRKFAGLQSDLSVTSNVDFDAASGLRRRFPSVLQKNRTKLSGEQVVRKSMHDIKLAFSEFYLSLILLQNYQSLNFTGFRKILKKHDKVHCSLIYEVNCSSRIFTQLFENWFSCE